MAVKAPQDHKMAAAHQVTTPDALGAEIAEVAGTPATFVMFGEMWEVLRKPPSLMIARLGRIDEDDPQAIGVLDQLIEHALGREQHKKFLVAYFAAAPDDGNDQALFEEAMTHILGATVGRPTS